MNGDRHEPGKAELFVTSDGSHSLYLPGMDEQYHSRHGAIQESNHVFIQSGLAEAAKLNQNISILEAGLGTGLNAFLTYLYAREHELHITYDAIEAYPLSLELIQKLNYPEALNAADSRNIFEALHKANDRESISLDPHFTFRKYIQQLQQFQPERQYDLVYFDAFAPEKQPELWEEAIFQKIYNALNPHSILVTYCAKGYVRRNMIAAGFTVERIPGPPGKRQMIRARKAVNTNC